MGWGRVAQEVEHVVKRHVFDALTAAQSLEQLVRAERREHSDALSAQLLDAALFAVEQHDGAGHREPRVAQSLRGTH